MQKCAYKLLTVHGGSGHWARPDGVLHSLRGTPFHHHDQPGPLPDVIETGALGSTHAPLAQSGGSCGPVGLLGYSGVGWDHAGGATEWARCQWGE
jgi:hypothetical protein